MLLIGVDEAGYGPKLGPLCHGYCAIRCADAQDSGAPDLWELLHPSVMRHPAWPGSVAVDDSKKIYSGGRGLDVLRHGVLSFMECMADAPPAAAPGPAELYGRLLPESDRAKLAEDVWNAAAAGDFPIREEKPRRPKKNAVKTPDKPPQEPIPGLREMLARKNATVLAVGARALSARHYNAALAGSGNKADGSWNVIVEQLAALLPLARPGERIHAVIDRQGGRKFYAGRISALFADAFAWVEVETPAQSVYRIEQSGRTVRVAFLVDGDGHSPPVALSSMAAKLARELCMQRLNGYFQTHAPELKPTAGYHGDANRFLRETKALRKKLGIENEALVRRK